MNKIKLFIASMLGAIALVFACVLGTRVNATTVSSTWKADDLSVGDSFSSKEVFDKTFFKAEVGAGASYTVTTNKSTATSDDTNKYTYTTGLLANNTTNATDRALKITTTVNSVTVKVYYTVSDGKFSTDDQSKSGNLTIYDSSEKLVFTSSKTSSKSNKTAYTDSYVIETADSIYLRTSGNRLCVFAIEASYEKAGEGQTTINFYDGESSLNTIIYDTGDTVDYVPTKANYTFDGWYTDSDLAEGHKLASNYTVDGTITALYAKFTEKSKYTVTYYVDGALDKTEENVYDGTSITYKPTFEFDGFDGWYLDSDCKQAIASNYTVSGNVSLYGKKVQLTNNLDQAHMSAYSGGSTTYYNNTIFNFVDKGTDIIIEANQKVLPDNTTSTYRINKANSSATDNRLITFKAPFDGYVKVWAAAGNADKNFYICESTYSTSTYIATKTKPAKNDLFEITAEIESGKTYVIGGDTRFYIYSIFVDKINLKFDAQYNETTAAASSKLRFIGTIEGLTYDEAANIKSIKFTFTFNGTDRECDVTTLYKSITGTNVTGYDIAANKMYFVYQLEDINKTNYQGKSLTNCKLIVELTTGSSVAYHSNITLPETFTSTIE